MSGDIVKDMYGLFDSATGAPTGVLGSDGREYGIASFDRQTGQITDSAGAAAVRGVYSPATVNSRDGMGRALSLQMDGVTYTITYGPNGPATLSGGGKTVTYNYSATGLYTNATVA